MQLFKKQYAVRRHQLRVSMANTLAEITALEDDWRSLEGRAKNDMALFQGFDWVYQWCKTRQDGLQTNHDDQKPYIVTVWLKDQLVSVWPLQQDIVAGVKTLSWLSSPALQYGDVLIDADCNANEVCMLAWEHIIKASKADLLQFDNVAATSPIYDFFSHYCATSGRSKSSILDIASFADWTAYQASVKKTTRRARRKRYNKFARMGDLKFEVHQSPERFKKLVEIAIEWKCQWLEKQHWPSALIGDPLFKTFLQNMGTQTLQDCCNVQWVAAELSLDGVPVALEIGAVYANRYFSFLGAYEDEFAKFSPGKIEMEAMIDWAMDRGISDFDFLCVPSQYKSDWTDTSIPVRSFSYACSVRGKAYHSIWLKRLRPAVKFGLRQIPNSQRKILAGVFKKQFGAGYSPKH